MRILPIIASGLLSLACSGPALAQGAPALLADASQSRAQKVMSKTAEPDAIFLRDEPAAAVMTLIREGSEWRVTFLAGGLPNGAATAADCELQAVGPQDDDDVIAGSLVPFEGELVTLSAADIGAEASLIEVRVGPEGAFVADSGAAARFCGVGSDIDGFYRRANSPE